MLEVHVHACSESGIFIIHDCMLFPMVKVDPGWVKTQMGGPHAHKSPEQGKIDISRQALLQ